MCANRSRAVDHRLSSCRTTLVLLRRRAAVQLRASRSWLPERVSPPFGEPLSHLVDLLGPQAVGRELGVRIEVDDRQHAGETLEDRSRPASLLTASSCPSSRKRPPNPPNRRPDAIPAALRRTAPAPMTSTNHFQQRPEQPEYPDPPVTRRFEPELADIHTCQRDAPGNRMPGSRAVLRLDFG